MNPVIGLDVAKGESQVQAFLDKRKPYRKSFSVLHNVEELNKIFLEFLKEIETLSGKKPSVVLESTGHYHSPVVQFLEEHQYVYISLIELKVRACEKLKPMPLMPIIYANFIIKKSMSLTKKGYPTLKPS
jgi:hypothetical protein